MDNKAINKDTFNKDTLTVKDVIAGVNNRELKIQEIADGFNCSDRTVQGKIKKVGYIWDAKASTYVFTGNNENDVLNVKFASLFGNNNNTRRASTATKKNVKATAKAPAKATKATAGARNTAGQGDEPDYIDLLLSGAKPNNKRVYRGYYYDRDVLSVLDKASNKSELINHILRETFKERGLL